MALFPRTSRREGEEERGGGNDVGGGGAATTTTTTTEKTYHIVYCVNVGRTDISLFALSKETF